MGVARRFQVDSRVWERKLQSALAGDRYTGQYLSIVKLCNKSKLCIKCVAQDQALDMQDASAG